MGYYERKIQRRKEKEAQEIVWTILGFIPFVIFLKFILV